MRKHGLIVFWTDYVRIDSRGTGTTYKRSDKPRPGYHQRTLAMTKGWDQDIYLAAAVFTKRKATKKAGRDLAYGRLMQLVEDGDVESVVVNGTVLPKLGGTILPKHYTDLVLDDPHCYSNIYGPPSPTEYLKQLERISHESGRHSSKGARQAR